MKVIVVVDMQNDFINGSLGTEEAQAIVPKVVQKVRGFDGMLAVTFDTHEANYLETQEGKHLPVEHCISMTHGWELNDDVAAVVNEKGGGAFLKPTFGSMQLARWLCDINAKGTDLESITFVGLCTDICVISNALLVKAALPEVPIIVDASCCAGVTPESHRNALAAMKMCQITIENDG